jgi:hypothetical protein
MHRCLRRETNGQQVPRKGAGIISPPGAGTLLGSDTRRCLRCEDNTRHVPRRDAGVVGSLWSDSRRGVASCLAMVAPSPPPPARRVAGQTRVFLFRHRGKSLSSSLPSPGEPMTVVVVVLRGEEYHVVAAIGGHELETPKAEHRPGPKRLLKIIHLELNGKVLPTRSCPYLARQLSAFWTREDPQPTSEFDAACPCPDGLMQDETQEGG